MGVTPHPLKNIKYIEKNEVISMINYELERKKGEKHCLNIIYIWWHLSTITCQMIVDLSVIYIDLSDH